jgi:hypothetical protein
MTQMKFYQKPYFILALLLMLLGVGIGVYLYMKPAEVKTTGKADFELNYTKWLAELNQNLGDTAANRYQTKKVEFTAAVAQVPSANDTAQLFILASPENVMVQAAFDASLKQELAGVVAGDSLHLLCSCGITMPDPEFDLLGSEIAIQLTRCNPLKWTKTEN